MAASVNAWQQHANQRVTTPNVAPSQGDLYSGNFSGGNNGGRGNHNAIFEAENDSLETTLDKVEAMMSNIDQEHGYRALADLSKMKKKLDEMVMKRDKFEAQIKKQLGMSK